MPSYTQAITTQLAEFLYAGELVYATRNTSFAMSRVKRSPLLWAGAPHVYCIARRLNSNVFMITLALQRLSNNALNLASPTLRVSVIVPGIASPVSLNARLQGSVYVWRNDSGTSPVLYPVDEWHDSTHPVYWEQASQRFQAELFVGHLAPASCIRMDNDDVAYVDLSQTTAALEYDVEVSGTLSLRSRAGDVRVTSRNGDLLCELTVEVNQWQWNRCGDARNLKGIFISGSASVDVFAIERDARK